MTKQVIIVAGGSGTRMNSDIPKQFIVVENKPVLMHAITRFYDTDPATKIIVVLPEHELAAWKTLCKRYDFQIPHQTVSGGASRFYSVRNGLERLEEGGVTAVHDGVRPLVSMALIKKCFDVAEHKGNAVPCLPLQDSLRQISGNENKIADRESFVAIQTPQCFQTTILKNAYQHAGNDSFTDDASVVEAAGEKINLVEGDRENIKITFPADLALAEVLLRKHNRAV